MAATGRRKTVCTWVSGSHQMIGGTARRRPVRMRNLSFKVGPVGFQHHAAYEALVSVLLAEHRSGTTDLIVQTGNAILLHQVANRKPARHAHLHTELEIVERLVSLFDTARMKRCKQKKARPLASLGHSYRQVLPRASGNQDGIVL